MQITRFDLELERVKDYSAERTYTVTDRYFCFENDEMSLKINRKTGLIDEYNVGGTDLLKAGSAKIYIVLVKENEKRTFNKAV